MDTRRCVQCGQPSCDHLDVPMRYPLRAAVRHYLLEKIRVMSRGWR
jgi:hypothetical protein